MEPRTTFDAKLAAELEQSGEKLLDVLRAAIDSQKQYTVQCPRTCCRDAKFSAPFPDIATMLKAAQWWTERVEGRAAQKPPEPAKPKLAGSITQATDNELEALLASDPAASIFGSLPGSSG